MSVLAASPRFSLAVAEAQLSALRDWLGSTPYCGEREVVSKLKTFTALCPLMGMYDGRRNPTVQKFEFEIAGVFRADFIAGHGQHFVLVEFEGAEEHSIFGPGGTNQMRQWGQQIQHGFSQIADWSWAKNEVQQSRIFQSTLGVDRSTETYVPVCGRDSSLIGHERSRLMWRHGKTSIASCRILFQTYDDLIQHFESTLDLHEAMPQPPKACEQARTFKLACVTNSMTHASRPTSERPSRPARRSGRSADAAVLSTLMA